MYFFFRDCYLWRMLWSPAISYFLLLLQVAKYSCTRYCSCHQQQIDCSSKHLTSISNELLSEVCISSITKGIPDKILVFCPVFLFRSALGQVFKCLCSDTNTIFSFWPDEHPKILRLQFSLIVKNYTNLRRHMFCKQNLQIYLYCSSTKYVICM